MAFAVEATIPSTGIADMVVHDDLVAEPRVSIADLDFSAVRHPDPGGVCGAAQQIRDRAASAP